MNKIFLTILLFIFFSPMQLVYGGWLHTDGKYIKDSAGNVVMLRGVNMYIRLQNDQAKYNAAKAMGANVVRLMLWKEDIENPGPNNPDWDLRGLAAIDDAVRWAHDAGLMVILVQQIWSFQVEPAPLAFLTDAALQESWLAMWRTLIDRYKNDDTVIGVDLMNEPWNIKPRQPNWPTFLLLWEPIAKNAVIKLRPRNPNLLFFVEGWGMETQPMWNDIAFLKQPNTVLSDHVFSQKTYQFLSERYSPYISQNIPVWLGEIGFLPDQQSYMVSQLSNFDLLGLHYTIYTFGASRWKDPYDIVNTSYALTSIGQIYSDHIKSLMKPKLMPPKQLRFEINGNL